MNTQYNNLQYPQMQNAQPYNFPPQPQGLVYFLNNSTEINNIPLNTNPIVGLCFSENLLVIRTIQGGAPIISTYKINSNNNEERSAGVDLIDKIKSLESRLLALEKSRGGSLSELL